MVAQFNLFSTPQLSQTVWSIIYSKYPVQVDLSMENEGVYIERNDRMYKERNYNEYVLFQENFDRITLTFFSSDYSSIDKLELALETPQKRITITRETRIDELEELTEFINNKQ